MRRFPNFLDSYLEFFGDTFTPRQFDEWSCLSIVAAALERKVWLRWSESWTCYPNIYVLLVSDPGEGKTSAMRKSGLLLEDTNKRVGGTVSILPNQATEAAFIKLLSHGRSFTMGTQIILQSAAYYRAEEASASLKNVFGDFLACLTDMYDCPNRWARSTIKDGTTPIEIKNSCVNLLAASTFNYLDELVNDRNIMGGFASRLLYVQSKNKVVQEQRFPRPETKEVQDERKQFREALIEDLCSIHKMMGPMTADAEYAAAWEAWWFESERKRKAMESENLRSLLVRTNLHMLKTSMLLSACESDDRVLKKRHWDKALSLVEPLMSEIPEVFRKSRAGQLDGGKVKNIPHAIIHAIKCNPNITRETLRASLSYRGADLRHIDNILGLMLSNGRIGFDGGKLKILGNTDDYL